MILSILDGKPMGELMKEIIKWKNRNYLTVTSVSLYFRLYLSFVIAIASSKLYSDVADEPYLIHNIN